MENNSAGLLLFRIRNSSQVATSVKHAKCTYFIAEPAKPVGDKNILVLLLKSIVVKDVFMDLLLHLLGKTFVDLRS